jgi:hypothetical protein
MRTFYAVVLAVGLAASARQSATGAPVAPRDLETWSFYDQQTQETETGLHLALAGKAGGGAYLSIVVRQPGRSTTAPPKSVSWLFGAGQNFVSLEHQPTLRIVIDAGKPYQTLLDLTPRLEAAPVTQGTGRNIGRASATPQIDEMRALAEAETVQIDVFSATYDLRPDQIKAIRGLVDRVAVRAPGSVTVLSIDKKRFATAEPLLFWAGVRPVGGGAIPPERRQAGTLTITRPDRRTRTEPVPWPAEGVSSRGWVVPIVVDREAPLKGEYRAVFTHAGRESPPVFFFIEDVPILNHIGASFVFPSPFRLATGSSVTLVVDNKSRETIRVAKRGGTQGSVRVTVTRAGGSPSESRSFYYPEPALLEAGGLPRRESFPLGALSWAAASTFPSDVIRAGASSRLALPIAPLLSAIQPALPAGEYDIAFSTWIDVLVAERGGPWGELSPMRLFAEGKAKAVK